MPTRETEETENGQSRRYGSDRARRNGPTRRNGTTRRDGPCARERCFFQPWEISPTSRNETFKESVIRITQFEKCPPRLMEVRTRCHCQVRVNKCACVSSVSDRFKHGKRCLPLPTYSDHFRFSSSTSEMNPMERFRSNLKVACQLKIAPEVWFATGLAEYCCHLSSYYQVDSYAIVLALINGIATSCRSTYINRASHFLVPCNRFNLLVARSGQ